MVKVVISGYGRMGHMVEAALSARGVELVAASEDIASFDKSVARECVCIDFTFPQSFRANYKILADNFKAVVVGTTGWNDIKDEVISYFEAKGTPMIYSSNYSVGVNVLSAAVAMVAKYLGQAGGYDPYIVEKHHIHKLDAPSGTAISLGKIVDESGGFNTQITSQRIGEVPGIHTLTLTGSCDKITLSHEAFSREGLAQGAVEAALMTERVSGVHEFKDLLFNSEAL